jgi:YnbE-like lipoprotein
MTKLLTKRRSGANPGAMRLETLLAGVAMIAVCGGCVQVQAPDKPIEINLNVNIKQEVVLSLKKDAAELITENPELFPK